MPELMNDTVRSAVTTLLSETFEGVPKLPSWYVDSGPEGAVLGTLATLSAAEAWREPAPGRMSVAAHVKHSKAHLDGIERLLRGDRTPTDWDDSWRPPAASEHAWSQLQSDLRGSYERLLRAIGKTDWPEHALPATIGAVAHAAYHLGAIKQIVRAIRRPGQ